MSYRALQYQNFIEILTNKNLKPEEIIKLAKSKEINALEVVNDFLKRLARFLAKLSLNLSTRQGYLSFWKLSKIS